MTNTCNYVLGPCADGTMAGKRCSERALVRGRCTRHAFHVNQPVTFLLTTVDLLTGEHENTTTGVVKRINHDNSLDVEVLDSFGRNVYRSIPVGRIR